MITGKQLVEEYIKTIGKYTYDQRDCIGSIWKILEKYGAKTDLVGSNWFARYELHNLRPLTDKSQLFDGCAVLKTVLPGERNYNLPARYKNHVDLIDYNHIGIGTSDGRILDSTKYGLRSDGTWDRNGPGWSTAKIGPNSWDIIAEFEDVRYYFQNVDIGEEAEVKEAMGQAVVYAEKGNTVNLRSKRSTADDSVVREYVKVGTTVIVTESIGGWSKLLTPNGNTGWMMDKFLVASEEQANGVVLPVKDVMVQFAKVKEELDALGKLLQM